MDISEPMLLKRRWLVKIFLIDFVSRRAKEMKKFAGL